MIPPPKSLFQPRIPPTNHPRAFQHTSHDPQILLLSQIKLSKIPGIDRPTEDLQPSTAMTSTSHVFCLTDFLTSIKVAAKREKEKAIETRT
jgi:hypothetical protein